MARERAEERARACAGASMPVMSFSDYAIIHYAADVIDAYHRCRRRSWLPRLMPDIRRPFHADDAAC